MSARSAVAQLMVALSLSTITPLCIASAEDPVGAKLEIANPVFDFGTVREGQKIKHEFVLHNRGEGDLQIERLVAACGCTAVNLSSSLIAAGSTGKILVELDTKGFSGEQHKTVRIISNDLFNPTATLTLKGRIRQEVSVNPARVSFGQVRRTSSPEQEVVVLVEEGSSAVIKDVVSRASSFEVVTQELSERRARLLVKLKPGNPLGSFRERFVVQLAGVSRAAVNVPVSAMIHGDLTLEPATVSFGVISPDRDNTRTVLLRNLSDQPIKVVDLKSGHPALSASVEESEPGKVFAIKVTVDPARLKRELRSFVRIRTDHPAENMVTLSVYGVAPPAL